ncbi:MAG TPA: methyltransferase domain-containing protein [Elusimicrobiales bacterium]|nr:methyltransferase domain-containing protein [Elusimicrobiales bacterium]
MDGNWKDDKAYAAHYNKLFATPAGEFGACIELLDLKPGDSLIDFGCGNGDFLLLASEKVKNAVGVDISAAQAEEARKKLAGRAGAEIILSPFLDFKPGARSFTKGFSRKALHHLTDPEKEQFLLGIAPAFTPGALFLLEDGMYSDFGRADLDKNWSKLLAEAAAFYGDSWEAKKKDLMHSFREEFAPGTDEWVRIFGKAGFKILKRSPINSFYGTLLAVKG